MGNPVIVVPHPLPERPSPKTQDQFAARYWVADPDEANGILHEIAERFASRIWNWTQENLEWALEFFFLIGDEIRITETNPELRMNARKLIARKLLSAAARIIRHGQHSREQGEREQAKRLFDRVVQFYAAGPMPTDRAYGYIEKEDDRKKIKDFLSLRKTENKYHLVDAIFKTGAYELLLESWNFSMIPPLVSVHFPGANLTSDGWTKFPEIEDPSAIYSGTMVKLRDLFLELDTTLQADIVEITCLIANESGMNSGERGCNTRRAVLTHLFHNFLRLRHALIVKNSPCRMRFGASGTNRKRLWALVGEQ